jgi:hypothetical protein
MGLFSSAFWRGFGSAFNLFPQPRDLKDLGADLLSHRRERITWRSGPANAAPLPPPPKNILGQERYAWYTVRPEPATSAQRPTQRKGSRAQRKKRR